MAKSGSESIPNGDKVILTPVEARQGNLGRPVLIVLMVGLLLAAFAWAAAEMWGESIAPVEQTPAGTVEETVPNTPAGTDTFDNNPPADTKVEPAPTLVTPTNP